MQITIELLNEHALNLLRDLEKMSIIRMISDPILPKRTTHPIKSRFAGRVSQTTAANLHLQLNQLRTSWEECNFFFLK